MRCSAFAHSQSGRAPARLGRSRRVLLPRAEAIAIPAGFAKVEPKGDRVFVKVANQEEKTRGGILLPTSAQKRPTSGNVVALGDGRVDHDVRQFYLKEGDTVLYSKFGFMYTEVKLQDSEYILIREDDVIGIFPRSDAQAEDIPELQPMADRVLIKVEEAADVTLGGVVLPDSAKERPVSGTVLRVGPGKFDKDTKERKQPSVAEGDKVLYFKYAGDTMETPNGTKYVILREDDILCKT